MTSAYLVDFDLEGDICECGEPCATHSPIARPRPLTERVDGETHVFSREWRANGSGPAGEGIQITRPRQAGGRQNTYTDEQLIAAIEANPDGTYAQVAGSVGVGATAIYLRLAHMDQEGRTPASVNAWRDRRSAVRHRRPGAW